MASILLMGRFGRLGNQLWTYANVFAYARERRFSCINCGFDRPELLAGKPKMRIQSRLGDRVKREAMKICYRLNLKVRAFPFVQTGESAALNLESDDEFETLVRHSGLVFMSGFYLCAPKSVQKRRDEVLAFFRPTSAVVCDVDSLVKDARANCSVLVGVHIRQGDYRTFCDGLMFYEVHEYLEAMRGMVEQLPRETVSFLVCSDEQRTAEEFPGLSVTVSRARPEVDLYALAKCDYIIGPNSSFSQWASFYGDVPLHVLDWRTAEKYKQFAAIKTPSIGTHFRVHSPDDFSKYSSGKVTLQQVLSASWLNAV